MLLGVGHPKLFVSGEIESENARTDCCVASHIAEGSRGLLDISSSVKPLGWCLSAWILIDTGCIRPVEACSGGRPVDASNRDRLREATLNSPNCSGLPTAYQSV